MAEKAKHAFGALENVDSAIASGKIDAYDILFVKDAEGKPYVGWIDKNGEKVIVDHTPDLAELEGELEAQIAAKASIEDVEALEGQISTKADAAEVEAQIGQAMSDSVASAKVYTDGVVEAALNEHLVKKYEITSIPEGTLVDYREKEIRVMCPVGTKWTKQSVGSTGNANMYYMGFKAYAPDGAVSFKEGDRGAIVDEMFDFTGDFAGTDEYGRNYSICWLALASYDEATDTWTYFGKNSSMAKYIGWTYVVEWYNENGIVIAADSIRINLSNESCHYSIEPYYVADIIKEVDTKIEEKIVEVALAYEVVEF